MIILNTTTLIEDYFSKWVNGDGKPFDDLASFKDDKPIINWALQFEWENIVGTPDAVIKIYSTLENKKTLEKTYTITTPSNVGDAHIIDMSGTIIAGFQVVVELNSVTSIDLSIDAVFN